MRAIANTLPTNSLTLVGAHVSKRIGTPGKAFVKTICMVVSELVSDWEREAKPVNLLPTATTTSAYHFLEQNGKRQFMMNAHETARDVMRNIRGCP